MRIIIVSLLSMLFLVVGCEQQPASSKPAELKLEKETKDDAKKTPDEEKKKEKNRDSESKV